LLTEITGNDRQISAWVDFAFMRDEANASSREAALGHGVQVGRISARMSNSVADALRLDGHPSGAPHRHVSGADGGGRGRELGRAGRYVGELCGRTAVGGATLPSYPEVMRRAGGFEFDPTCERLIVEPVQHALVFFRGHHLFSRNVDTAAHGYEQEGMQSVGAQVAGQLENSWELMRVVTRD